MLTHAPLFLRPREERHVGASDNEQVGRLVKCNVSSGQPGYTREGDACTHGAGMATGWMGGRQTCCRQSGLFEHT